jgi:xenotropic and polytropic retrovirus receptor 1
MKFAKELDENAVPEWKSKYLDYKAAKKRLKAVRRAIREVDNRSPNSSRRPDFSTPFTSLRDAPVKNLLRKSPQANGKSQDSNAPLQPVRSHSDASPHWSVQGSEENNGDVTPRARPIDINERSPLRTPEARHANARQMTRYGSIIGSPPRSEDGADLRRASTLELPMPSLDPGKAKERQSRDESRPQPDFDPDYDRPVSPNDDSNLSQIPTATLAPPESQMQHRGDAYDPTTLPADRRRIASKPFGAIEAKYNKLFRQNALQRSASTPGGKPPFVTRLFSFSSPRPPNQPQGQDIALEAYRELDFRKVEFFSFLDKELAKIESFYKSQEEDAIERLKTLRGQLHTMRDRRLLDVQAAEANKAAHRHLSVVKNVGDKIGKTTKSMAQLGTPSLPALQPNQPGSTAQQDYIRRQHDVP